MDLRSGKPVWLDRPPPPVRAPALKRDVECDVAIIGAGITGALVARSLLAAGLRVVVLDRRNAGRGSTAASTGLLMYQPDSSLAEITQSHGRAAAKRVYTLGRDAIRELRRLSRELSGYPAMVAKRTLYVASNAADSRKLTRECARTRRIGFPVTRLTRQDLEAEFHFSRPAAPPGSRSAQIDAYRFTLAVWQDCRSQRRLRLYQKTSVTQMSEDPDGVTLRTSAGHRVRASHVIVAAGYEAGRWTKTPLMKLNSTYVIASEPMPATRLVPLRCLMWDTARPYFYLRTTPDHRIIFGGMDEPFASPSRRDRMLRSKTRALENQFAELFPALAFKAAFAWTGTFASTRDGLPCIGPAKPGSRIFAALGYGGNGITFSQIAARLLTDLCLGRTNSDLHLFRLDRPLRRRPRRPRRA